MRTLRTLALVVPVSFVALCAEGVRSQDTTAVPPDGAPQQTRVEESRVREVLSFLASDEMAGRDTPSTELERAADWIAEQFAAAGLAAIEEDDGEPSYFHRYTLPGVRLTTDGARLSVRLPDGGVRALQRQVDFRVYAASRAFDKDGTACRVSTRAELVDGRRRLFGGRQPVLVPVAATDPLWRAAATGRTKLASRRLRNAAPIVLVREGRLDGGSRDESGALWCDLAVAAPTEVDVALRNVVGAVRGTDEALRDEWVLVTAHYDHVGVGLAAGDDAIFNGADDNATGTTAVVTLAEAIGKRGPMRRSVLFVAFSAEEKGLRGSAEFAKHPSVPLESIATVINIEMIGRPPQDGRFKAWVTGRDRSDFEEISAAAFARTGVEVVEFPMAAALFRASDNWPFAQRKVVAHSISAGSLHSDYHQPTDEVERIDTAHMTRIIDGLFDVVAEFASRDERPSWRSAAEERLPPRRGGR